MKNWKLYAIVVGIAGSVFIFSDLFMDPLNAPKYYWTIGSILITVFLVCLRKRRVQIPNLCDSRNLCGIGFILLSVLLRVQSGMLIVTLILYFFLLINLSEKEKLKVATFLFGCGCVHAGYYLVGIWKFLPMSYAGCFDNIAGLVATEALFLSLGFLLFRQACGYKKSFIFIGIVTILMCIVFTGARTGILAIGALLVFQVNKKFYQYVIIAIMVLGVLGICFFSPTKMASSQGRTLIYHATWEMIKKKPWIGYGKNSFQADYMSHQASFLKSYHKVYDIQLADNVKHPFNEFLYVAMERGIPLAFLWVLCGCCFFFLCFKSRNRYDRFQIPVLVTLGICSCFFYPLHYIGVWLLALFCLSFSFQERKTIFFRSWGQYLLLSGILILFGIHMNNFLLEIKWKQAFSIASKGDTSRALSCYSRLSHTSFKDNALFLYNYAMILHEDKKYVESILQLQKCQLKMNDYFVNLLLADNYYYLQQYTQARYFYQQCSDMIPCRFWPLYRIFLTYKQEKNELKAREMANNLQNKKTKIDSYMLQYIQSEVSAYLRNNH